jgi:hypothetical protein
VAGHVDLVLRTGITFPAVVTRRDRNTRAPIPLPGYTAKLQVRASAAASEVLLELTSPTGGLVVDGVTGRVFITVKASATANATWTKGVYDLVVTNTANPEDTVCLIEGSIVLRRAVTR